MQGVSYTAGEPVAVAVAEGKSKRKSSGAPSVGSVSGRYHFNFVYNVLAGC
jgi:plant G-box-binding factor